MSDADIDCPICAGAASWAPKQIERAYANPHASLAIDGAREGSHRRGVVKERFERDFLAINFRTPAFAAFGYVRKKQRKAVERQIANYRKFRELTREWVDLGIELCKLKADRLKE